MGSFSLVHWLVVGLVAVLLFGPKRLAGVGKGLGEGLRGFKEAIDTSSSGAEEEAAAKKKRKRLTAKSQVSVRKSNEDEA